MKEIYRNRRLLILSFGGWTLFGVFFAFQAFINNSYYGQPTSFRSMLSVWLICGYAWAALTPLVVFLSEKFTVERGAAMRRNLIIHLFAGSLLALLQLSVFVFAREWLLGNVTKPFSFSQDFQTLFVADFQFNLLVYWSLVGIFHLREYSRRYRERERQAARLALDAAHLETALANAQLDALKMQLHPHFLFNTLNTISVLMRGGDAETADRTLLRLSELLRAVLKSDNVQEVSLRQELKFLRGYLEIEQTRFQDCLKIDYKVEPETLPAQVPNLILQPLVENAIRHGFASRTEAGTINIEARRENNFLALSVSDDGCGLSGKETESNGIGLSNTRARLEKLYGAKHVFDLSSAEPNGLRVTIKIPFRIDGNNA